MTIDDLTKKMGLEHERHFQMARVEAPVIQPELYTTLGRKLFEFYQKYKIESADQREIESLAFVLQTFVIHRNRKPFWKRFWGN